MIFLGILSVTLLILLSGCESASEAQGYSRIPQNRPTNWELNPVGNLAN